MAHPNLELLLARSPESLEHLGRCADCRRIVGLMQEPAEEDSQWARTLEVSGVPIVERSVFSAWEELPDARGGMGQLFRAFDRRLGRHVAIKQVRPAEPGDPLHAALVKRLEGEARLTARLQHPAIVVIYEVGRFPDGELFYSMPLVKGRPLSKEIDERRTLADRLGLLPQLTNVAEAIAYSHEQAVLHRDLKPDNVLVGAFGEAVVIDWGLAKDLAAGQGGALDAARDSADAARAGGANTAADGLTAFGVGTAQYMAPEQARGEEPTPAVDVYALGATLYHLLSGKPPYGFGEAGKIRKLLEAGPPRPLEELVPEVPPELLHICARAMAREPAGRYPGARELADELRRFQTGVLLQSRRYSAAELLRHFLRRNRKPLLVAAAALVLLAAVGIVSVVKIERQREQAEESRLRAEWSLRRAEGVLASKLAPEAARRLEALTLAVRAAGPELTSAVPGAPSAEALQGLFDALAAGPAPLALEHGGAVTSFAVSPDGALLAGTGDDRTALLWDAHSGKRRAVFTSKLDTPHQVRFAPKGDRISLCGGEARAEVWEIASARRLELSSKRGFAGCEFGPDGAFVTAADELVVRDPATGAPRRSLALPSPPNSLAVGALGHLAVAGVDGTLRVWPPGSDAPLLLAEGGAVPTSLAFDQAGRRLALIGRDGTGRLFTLSDSNCTAEILLSGEAHASASRARFSPDGRALSVPLWSEEEVRTLVFELAPAGRGAEVAAFAQEWAGEGRFLADVRGTFRLYDAHDGGTLLDLLGHRDEVKAAAWLGDAAASASRDGAEYLWDLRQGQGSGLLLGHTGEITAAALSPARDRLLTASLDGSVRLWALPEAREQAALRFGAGVTTAAWSPEGAAVLAGGLDGAVHLIDARDGSAKILWQAKGPITVARFFPGEPRALCGSLDGQLAVVDLPSGAALALRSPGGAVTAAAVSRSGREIVSAHADGSARLWDASSGAQRALLPDRETLDEPGDHEGHTAVTFTPAGTVLLGRPFGKTLVASATDLALRGELAGRAAGAGSQGESLSPDGTLFAAVASDGRVLVHDLRAGTTTALAGNRAVVLATAFSADGKLLATAGLDGVVRLFELASGRMLVEQDSVLGPATAVALTSDARFILAGYRGGGLRLLPATPAAALERACATLRRFGREGDVAPYCAGSPVTAKSRNAISDR